MACKYHQEKETVKTCKICGLELCEECCIDIKGKTMCEDCIEKGIFGTKRKIVSGTKNAVACFVLSLVPGVGHVYLGLKNKGLAFMLAFFGILVFQRFIDPLGPIIAVIWIYSFIDSLTSCGSLNKGDVLEDVDLPALDEVSNKLLSRKNMLGVVLIAIGALGLLDSFADLMMNVLREYYNIRIYINFEEFALPAILLVLGCYLVFRAKKQEKTEG